MKSKKIVVILLIALILMFISILAINYNSDHSYTYEKDGIKYAVTVDGVAQSSFPSKGLYRVDVTCENATCKWLYDDWKLAIEDIKGNVSCDIDFVTITKNNLNDYIIGLTGTTQGTGQVVNENGYRYEGKNPNNYIWFNNELWRIIGVFDENLHGQSNTNLVKIIKVNSIGGLAWDKSASNNWVSSSLNKLLNGAYLNAQDGTDTGYCYISSSVQTNCDYRVNGIQNGYRSMIQNVTWYLGGYDNGSITADQFYAYEKGILVSGQGTPKSTTGYIGLMYPSDYGYSVLSSSCARTTSLISYSDSSCGGQSWIVGNTYEWVLFYLMNDNRVFHIVSETFYWDYPTTGLATRPVLYLKADVYYIDGDGSIEDPIIIGE